MNFISAPCTRACKCEGSSRSLLSCPHLQTRHPLLIMQTEQTAYVTGSLCGLLFIQQIRKINRAPISETSPHLELLNKNGRLGFVLWWCDPSRLLVHVQRAFGLWRTRTAQQATWAFRLRTTYSVAPLLGSFLFMSSCLNVHSTVLWSRDLCYTAAQDYKQGLHN